nr:MAG TPA: hypothetical protein [Caudoviricetes sp.]
MSSLLAENIPYGKSVESMDLIISEPENGTVLIDPLKFPDFSYPQY